ncbi:MAG: hypothetical protein CMH46_08680 [Muricauda sp.]|nr:DUF6377 domain-containing protein [Allomuricauda sp.]MAU15598.1 hypothetical protein [Allomuricauda sp.]
MYILRFLLTLGSIFLFTLLRAQDARYQELIDVMGSYHVYDSIKKAQIDRLKDSIGSLDINEVKRRIELNQQLFNHYKIFKSDSAYQYALKLKELGAIQGDTLLLGKSYIDLADICIAVGMYKEALEYLGEINIDHGLSKEDMSMYYGLYGRCYGDLAEYSDLPRYSKIYIEKARHYREKALEHVPHGTFFHLFMTAFHQYESGDLDEAERNLGELLQWDLSLRDQALTHYVLGEIDQRKGMVEKAEDHYIKAAIADIKTSTKESLAIIRLSELLFKKKELEIASALIEKAYDDAQFYGAQQRKLQVGAILPLIGDEIISNIEKEKNRLYWQYIGAIGLVIALGVLITIILFQYKRLQKTRSIIAGAHSKLKETHNKLLAVNQELKERNQEIGEINGRLMEANKIKEEYLGFFFTEYDNIFEKFNDVTTEIEADLETSDIERAKFRLSRYDLRKEKEKLLSNFDTAFINLFPNFIQEFNALMKNDSQVKLKKEQTLNKELRIYALLRLGITHNDKIAQILGYSVNSVYAYKSKIRNNSTVDNSEFDKKLIENTTIKL